MTEKRKKGHDHSHKFTAVRKIGFSRGGGQNPHGTRGPSIVGGGVLGWVGGGGGGCQYKGESIRHYSHRSRDQRRAGKSTDSTFGKRVKQGGEGREETIIKNEESSKLRGNVVS